jgi:hypothetical protein
MTADAATDVIEYLVVADFRSFTFICGDFFDIVRAAAIAGYSVKPARRIMD